MCANENCQEFSKMPQIARYVPVKLGAVALAITLGFSAAAQPGVKPLPAPASQDAKMQWFREAKFGLFIHWGLYAIPAGEWKGQPIAGIGEWIMNRAKIPAVEYAELAKQFNPVKFDAEAWAQMAQDAGMKYLVITSKHHDGFAMYHSLVSKYNVYDATPWHRDPLAELAAACARHHIKFGFYYSQAQDWHEPNGAGNTWDFGPDDKKDFDQYLRGKAEPQVKELLTNYGPICLIWFDTPRMMDTNDRGQRFIDIVKATQPATLIDAWAKRATIARWAITEFQIKWCRATGKSPRLSITHGGSRRTIRTGNRRRTSPLSWSISRARAATICSMSARLRKASSRKPARTICVRWAAG
jgi:alpha-L-fucosidase